MMSWEKRKILSCVVFYITIFCNQVYGQENVMTHLSYRSNINHRYAVTWVTAHMKNPSDNPTEILFKMTLPKTAFISGLIMEVNGQNYTSLVKEKEAARKTYNKAKGRGKHAGLVEKSESAEQKFQVSTNVEARGKVIFYLKYEELLLRNKGKYTQNIQIKPGVKPSKLDVAVHIKENEEILGLEVTSLPSDAHTNNGNSILSSSSNDTQVHMVNFNEAVVRYDSQGPEGLYGELTLTYDVKRQLDAGEIQVSGDYFVHFFSPDGLPKMAAHTVFILDVSGSMSGQPLRQLKDAMLKILSDLKPEDSFELLSFSDSVKTLGVYSASQRKNMKRANKKISKLSVQGSTNINDALIKGFENVLNRSQSSADQVVFLTDGEPTTGETDLSTILNNIQKINMGKIPLYALAFGDGPDYKFLSKLSFQNRGFARKIPVDSRSDDLLRGFYQEIGTPLMADIDIQYPGDAVNQTSIVKKGWSTLQSGNEVVVAGQLNPGKNEVDPKIAGIIKTGSHQFKVPRLSKTTQHSQKENFIGRLWAYLTIQDLLNTAALADDAQKVEELKGRALSLALKYNFVTKLTSLVVVRPEDLPPEDQVTTEKPSSNDLGKFSNGGSSTNTGSSGRSSGRSGRGGNHFVDNDPHFLIQMPGLNVSFCFDFHGNDGDILNLVHDKKTGTLVNGEVSASHRSPNKTYFTSMFLSASSINLTINTDSVSITHHPHNLYWNIKKKQQRMLIGSNCSAGNIMEINVEKTNQENYYEHIYTICTDIYRWKKNLDIRYGNMNLKIQGRKLHISLGDGEAHFVVTRSKNKHLQTFFGFYIEEQKYLTNFTTGLLGEFISKRIMTEGAPLSSIQNPQQNNHRGMLSILQESTMRNYDFSEVNAYFTKRRMLRHRVQKVHVDCLFVRNNGRGLLSGMPISYKRSCLAC